MGLELLHKKSGSRAPLRNFRIAVKKLVETNYLPEYRLAYDGEADQVRVYSRGRRGGLKELRDVLGVK